MVEAANQNFKLNLKLNSISKVPLSQFTSTLLQSFSVKNVFLNVFIIRQPFLSKTVLGEQH